MTSTCPGVESKATASVLARARPGDVVMEPYPHLVIRDALAPEIYARLAADFPPGAFFTGAPHKVSNQKYHRKGRVCLASQELSAGWKDFVRYHTSREFFQEFLSIFGHAIGRYYPELEDELGVRLAEARVVHRDESIVRGADIALDCSLFVDFTFTERPFRAVHVDSPMELYAGLLYFRDPTDDSTGGSLGLFDAADEARSFPQARTIRYPGASEFPRDRVELVREVPYESNTLVMFLNTWRSLHGALPRSPTLLPRRAANIVGEIAQHQRCRLFRVEVEGEEPPALSRRLVRRARRVVEALGRRPAGRGADRR